MNKLCYRLVFDAVRGMRVAVAEHVGAPQKGSRSASSRLAKLRALLGVGALLGSPLALAAPPIPSAASLNSSVVPRLPVRSIAPSQLARDFGRFNVMQPNAEGLLVTQQDPRAIINWSSFNIGKGNTVKFEQPAQGSTLNLIWDANPSVIQGRITANAEVILQNSNGLIFAPTARVDTGRFVATALQIDTDAYRAGFRGVTDGSAAFDGTNRNSFVSLERGAEVRTAAGGDVLIFAPRVVNDGRIETPSGQTVLGAGKTVYVAASADARQRGLIVGIQPFGGDPDLDTVTQGEARSYKTVGGETVVDTTPDSTVGLVKHINEVVAEQGSINLVALALRQNGNLRATTAVKGQNGVIQLQSQSAVDPLNQVFVNGRFVYVPQAAKLGSVILGSSSLTQVSPSSSQTDAQTSAETFNNSRIRVEGQQVLVKGGAVVSAPSGTIELLASDNPTRSVVFDPASSNLSDHSRDPSRIVVESGATLSVAGVRDVSLPMSRNQGRGRLFQIELADSPVQRNGPLYREEIFFDARNPPKIGNVSGLLAGVGLTAQELSTSGGSLSIQSDGAVAVDAGAKLDVSGGSVAYQPGTLKRSLLRAGNQWTPIDRASADTRYEELGNSKARTDLGTAVFQTVQVPGYVEGKDAGQATVAGRRVYLAGAVNGQTVVGPNQDGRRSAATPVAGGLTVGRQRVTDSSLADVVIRPNVSDQRPDALFANPTGADADAALSTIATVATNGVQGGGIGRLTLYAANAVKMDAGISLDLGVGGSLRIQTNGIDLAGRVRAAGGSISLTTLPVGESGSGIALRSGSELDVSGTWSNDNVPLGVAGRALAGLVSTAGGRVSLQSAGGLVADTGVNVDVSAGARRSGSTVLTGSAGTLSMQLNAGANAARPLPGDLSDWRASLRGFDFGRGGTLAISGLPSLTLGGSTAQDRYFDVVLFGNSGFGSMSLGVTRGDLNIASNFNLSLKLKNYLLTSVPDPSGRFAAVGVLADASRRAPVSLSLAANTAPLLGVRNGNSLLMTAGSRISTEAGGSLNLSARRDLVVAGSLAAPGGTISLSIGGTRGGAASAEVFEDRLGFLPDQALWLDGTARLSVAGTQVSAPNAVGNATGKLLGGGTVNLSASRGYVVAKPGALIDLSGQTGTLQTAGAATPQTLSRNAGTLNLSTSEGFAFDADVLARAPSSSADGGSIALTLSLGGRDRQSLGVPYPQTPRTIVVAQDAAAAPSLNRGDNLSIALGNGIGKVSAQRLADAGFSQVSLRADDRIELHGAMDLAARRSLSLEAASLSGSAATIAHLAAPYVSLGDRRTTEPLPFDAQPYPVSGSGSLTIDAALVEVYGTTDFTGWRNIAINADADGAGTHGRTDGEIRLLGTARGLANTLTGAVSFAGSLSLTAGQVYTETLSSFTLKGSPGNSALVIQSPAAGSTTALPLSAFGQMSLQADSVNVSGVVRQPFGSISIQADRVVLGASAVLSVSGDGLTVPVGTTVNGRSWQFRPNGVLTSAGMAKDVDRLANPDIRTLGALPVDKGVRIQASTLSADPAAQLSARGGGDAQAWEFIAGVGGSTDYLAKPGLYAVIPGFAAAFAPYDSEVQRGSVGAALTPGSYIDIGTTAAGLAAGRYTLLPARYALLPGAYVVSLAANLGKAPLLAPLANDDGSVVVTGSLGTVGSASRSDAGTRFLVEPANTFRARSRIDLAGINDFLRGVAKRQDLPAVAIARNGGRIVVQADNPFNWASRLDLARSGDGTAGELDLSMKSASTAIVDDIASPPSEAAPGSGLVSATALTASQASSILIGGIRDTRTGVTISTLNDRVDLLAKNTALQAGEVILNARGAVNLASGTTLRATGAPDDSARTLALSDGSALAVVSTLTGTEVARTYSDGSGSTGTGSLTVSGGATVGGPAVRLVATGRLSLASDTSLNTNNLGIESAALAVGTPTSATSATVLDGALLSSIQQVGTLRLTSQGGIDFFGARAFTLDRLVLDAPILRGSGASGDLLRFTARQIELRNSNAVVPDFSRTGTMDVVVEATAAPGAGASSVLTLGQAAQSGAGGVFLGFRTARLGSSGDVVFNGSGLFTTQGDATLTAARITAQTGAIQGLNAPSGLLSLAAAIDGRTLGNRVGQGASLSFSGQRITQGAWVDAPAGVLNFTAAGASSDPVALSFAPNSITSVAGFSVAASPTWTVYGGAGSIRANAGSGLIAVAGRLDVSAPGDASAGSISLSAYGIGGGVDLRNTAALAGAGGSGQLEGRIAIDADHLLKEGAARAGLDRLSPLLAAGGFGNSIDVRVRSGDLLLSAGSTLRAQRIGLAADAGSVTLDGSLDASAPAGGTVRVAAGIDVKLTGSVIARSARKGGNGGDVLLSSATGAVSIASSATIDAGGDDAADGRIVLRAGRDDATGAVAISVDPSVGASRLKAGEIDLEAVRRYTGFTSLGAGTTSGTRLGQDSLGQESQDYLGVASGVLPVLAFAADPRVHLRPGIEIVSPGDFTVTDDWNLWNATAAQGEAGFLTVRAGGHLNVNGSISDGFDSATRPASDALTEPTEIKFDPAWSYRLVAGASTAAANPLATLAGAAGNLTVAPTKLIRTTSGSIELAASRDIVLAGGGATRAQQAVVYVAGKPSTLIAGVPLIDSAWIPQFTSHGGTLELTAGNDIIGVPTTQQFGAWFYHTGNPGFVPTAWWTGFDAFRQGVGNFGGGNLRVVAGRDVRDLGVVSPTSGRGPDVDAPATSPFVVENGGDVTVVAGRDIAGGTYFLGRGLGLLSSGRDITAGASSSVSTIPAIAPVLGLMDGQWASTAGGTANIAAAYNPTMLPSANSPVFGSQRISDNDAGLFFSYGAESGLTVRSISGGIGYAGDLPAGQTPGMGRYWSSLAASGPAAEQIQWSGKFQGPTAYLPPRVNLAALGADLNLWLPASSSGSTLYPSAAGGLGLYAAGDVVLSVNSAVGAMYVSDRSPDQLPTPRTPVLAIPEATEQFTSSTFNAPVTPDTVAFGTLASGSSDPVRIAAGGSINLAPRSGAGRVVLVFPKRSELYAGANILDLNLIGQQFGAGEETSIVAGSNILETPGASGNRVTLGGPGFLRIEAGRQLDLGTSRGVETVGKLYNTALPADGAELTLAAGGKRQLAADNFLNAYLTVPTPGASAADQANAFADAYFTSIGQDPGKLGPDALALRATLTQRFADSLRVTGVESAVAVQARRDSLVRFVRQALALDPLPEQALPAAFDATWAGFKQLSPSQQVSFAAGVLSDLFAKTYLADGRPYAALWNEIVAQNGGDIERFEGSNFEGARTRVLFAELNLVGGWASSVPKSGGSTRADVFGLGARAVDLAGLGVSFSAVGDLDLVASGVQASAGGNINLLAAGGQINVGPPGTIRAGVDRPQGVVTYGVGSINAYSDGNFQVNSRKVFVVGQGDITVWSAQGNIDSGRGANTAISVPPLVPVRGPYGDITFALPSTTVGSGIGILKPPTGDAQGNIGLFAPKGEVLALDALIRSPGRITLAADVVRGADNIVGGSVVGAPVVVPAISVAPPAATNANTESQVAANSAAVGSRSETRSRNSLLTVELLGLGAESNDPDCTEQDEQDKKCVRPKKK